LTSVAQATAAEPRDAPQPAATAAHSSDAAANLFNLHRKLIHVYCLNQLRDRQEADDAVQSTFLYALALLQRGERPRADVPWLYAIAHNVCRTRRRALRRRSKLESAVDLETLHDRVGRNDPQGEDLASLRSSLAALPAMQRRALLLREWQGLSYAEIAPRLGLSESAVEAVLFRARRNLARTFQRTANHAASLTGIATLFRGVRRLASSATTVKTTATALALGAVVAAGVQPLITTPHTPVHQPAGPPAGRTSPPLLREHRAPTRNRARVAAIGRNGLTLDAATVRTTSAPAAPQTQPATPAGAQPSDIGPSSPSPPEPTSTPVDQTVAKATTAVRAALSTLASAVQPVTSSVPSQPVQTVTSTVTTPLPTPFVPTSPPEGILP
jgi:RNA polymerase sigma factor (sigma-70 family)